MLKRERVNRQHCRTRTEARADIFDYIERCHNPRRRLELQQEGGTTLHSTVHEIGVEPHTFDRLIGTSAGARTATLLAADYKPEEMLEALTEMESGKGVFVGFIGQSPPFTVTDEGIATSATRRLLNEIDDSECGW